MAKKTVIVEDDLGSKAPEEFEISSDESVRAFKQRVGRKYNLSGEFNLVTDSNVNLNNETECVYDQVKDGESISILPRGKGGY